jgi:chromosome segregation ATPase
MQSNTTRNRFILALVSFVVSFILSLLFSWNITQSLAAGFITIIAAYSAVLVIDKRHRHQEIILLDSLHYRIKEIEGLKHNLFTEIHQLENHHYSLVQESSKLQNQVIECRNTRDSLNRELSTYSGQKKQLESQINRLQVELEDLEHSKVDLNKTFSHLSTEKRRLETTTNALRVEVSQLQSIINELLQQKTEIENNLVLLERLKPSLEEKLYELRVDIQELDLQVNQRNQLISTKNTEYQKIESKFNQLQQQTTSKKVELNQIKDQIQLLEEERDTLQNQIWELIQQEEINLLENSRDFDLIDDDNISNKIIVEPVENVLVDEWLDFSTSLTETQVQILKIILEEQNPYPKIKKIAEENITMPNILIDSINEQSQEIIGEIIINTNSDLPTIYPEYIPNLKQVMITHEKNTPQKANLI